MRTRPGSLDSLLELDLDTRKGPRIIRSPITVALVAGLHERLHVSAGRISELYGVDLAGVYAALAYYLLNPEEIEPLILPCHELSAELCRVTPSDERRLLDTDRQRRWPGRRPLMQMTFGVAAIDVWPISEHEATELSRDAEPIGVDPCGRERILDESRADGRLARFYVSLCHLFAALDGGLRLPERPFSFPFRLEAVREWATYYHATYLLVLDDTEGGLTYHLSLSDVVRVPRRQVARRASVRRRQSERDLSPFDIVSAAYHILGFLEGHSESAIMRVNDFVKHVPAASLSYGWEKGKPFTRHDARAVPL